MKMIYYHIVLLIVLSYGCGASQGSEVNPGFFKSDYEHPYLMNSPDHTMNLDRQLIEISGLTYSAMSHNLLAVNDEKALIFKLDPMTGHILDKIDFGKADDYEGIANKDNLIYVVESNGNVKVVNENTGAKVTEYDDILSRDQDVEGIVYDVSRDRILLAAKGDSRIDDNVKEEKALYAMNPSNGKIHEQPAILINIKDEVKKMETRYINSNVLVNLSVASRLRKFAPSGIAIHPNTGHIYIVSAQGRTLSVLDPQGTLLAVIFLNNSLHRQPEGIAFDKEGNLYVSNEGKAGRGVIHRYSPI